jgi:hypothetical protein
VRDAKINIIVVKTQFQTRCENMTDCDSCAYFLGEEDAIIWQYIFLGVEKSINLSGSDAHLYTCLKIKLHIPKYI